MKIAVVAPCPVPYAVGGAEKLWWGLVGHLNEHTEHQAELIKLPSPEADLRALLASYEQFAKLNLSGFDLVVSGKYPAWMVEHPRHVVYMLHRLRGLYDAYPGAAQLPRDLAADHGVSALTAYMQRTAGRRSAVPEFFERVREVLAHAPRLPGLLDFPGPFARALVHWLDGVALAPEAIERFAAISHTVAQRPGYFPFGADVHVAWPPPHMPRVAGERFEHFFTASRLDGPKRIGLLIEAMRYVRADVPLLIAGTGPEQERLQVQAADDPRIRLLGFQSDHAIERFYADALAVPFVPYAEDYGLVTVEAMQAGKPVITTSDAGGPCELVVDGGTGIVCEAEPRALGHALQRLADDRALAKSLGEAGRRRAAAIGWDTVVDTIIPTQPVAHRAPRTTAKRLVLVSTFGIYPPRHGGQSRIYNLYSKLQPEYETTIISFGEAGSESSTREIAPGLREVRVAKSREHEALEQEIAREVGTPVTDVVMPELHRHSPLFGAALAREAEGAHAVIASHPYLYPALTTLGVPIWFEAHNLEWKLKQPVLGTSAPGERLLEAVRRVEGDCARAAEVVICASAADAADLEALYGVERARIILAPNGTDCSRISYVDSAARAQTRAQMGIDGQRFVLFVGSGHWPNIEAVKRIMAMAAEIPDAVFTIVGSVCYAFSPSARPPNVLFLGEVDDVTRNLALEFCDVALNPMEFGSGTNLKMLDFFAAGVPVLSTPTGARGIDATDGMHCRIAEIDDFAPALAALLDTAPDVVDAMTRAARTLVEEAFDWTAIASRVKLELAARPGG
jgi:glycosyltransferase involved in cell wall biosynthesis